MRIHNERRRKKNNNWILNGSIAATMNATRKRSTERRILWPSERVCAAYRIHNICAFGACTIHAMLMDNGDSYRTCSLRHFGRFFSSFDSLSLHSLQLVYIQTFGEWVYATTVSVFVLSHRARLYRTHKKNDIDKSTHFIAAVAAATNTRKNLKFLPKIKGFYLQCQQNEETTARTICVCVCCTSVLECCSVMKIYVYK